MLFLHAGKFCHSTLEEEPGHGLSLRISKQALENLRGPPWGLMGVLTYKEQNIDNMHLYIYAYAECVSCLLAETFQTEVYVMIVVLI